MPDEEIDKVVRDAANQHHPPYDDEAWGKMEVLLDKHLPQKKDRKKPVIFWLAFLLLGSAVFFAIQNADKNNSAATTTNTSEEKGPVDKTTAATSNIPGNQAAGTTAPDNGVANQQSNTIPGTATGIITNTTVTTSVQKKIAQVPVAGNSNNNAAQQYVTAKKNVYHQKGRSAISVKKPGVAEDNDDLQTQKDELTANKADAPAGLPATVKTDAIAANDLNTTADKKDTESTKADTAAKAKPEAEKTVADEKNKTATNAAKKNRKSFTDKIALTISAGGDLSFIELNNAGKLKPAYGAGLSYAIGKHVVVSSGFYVSKKIYSATPYQYKFSGYGAPPNLKEIGADCKIFEIPVSVYYSFGQAKNHNWLAGMGLSSLLMKSESYDYRYQTPTGQTYSYEKTINNQNKHYFSVLTISGGYQYKLNNRVSFIAEPYIKIPLKGIGAGEIKLNSTGLLITAAIKPFAKKK
ncbi:DUF5585 domain-containing protein [Ferruginibacter profundus]